MIPQDMNEQLRPKLGRGGYQTRADKLMRNTKNQQNIMAWQSTEDQINPLVIFMVVFFRYEFGKDYLKKRGWGVLWTIALFALVGFLLQLWLHPILPDWVVGKMDEGLLWLLYLGLAFVGAYKFRKFKIKMHSLKYEERNTHHAGTSYFRPLAVWWLNQLNKAAVFVQKCWNAILFKKNRFKPRNDVYYNDIGLVRKTIEPFFTLLISAIFFYSGLFIVGVFFLCITFYLRAAAIGWIDYYETYYHNMQNEELMLTAQKEALGLHQEVGRRTRDRLWYMNNDDLEGYEKHLQAEEDREEAEFQRQLKAINGDNVAPPVKDDFSIEDSFKSITAKQKKKNK